MINGPTCYSTALDKRIPCKPFVTNTNWNMISNSTIGIAPTQPRTRVNTLLALARLVCRTVIIKDTFWTAVWRISYHSR